MATSGNNSGHDVSRRGFLAAGAGVAVTAATVGVGFAGTADAASATGAIASSTGGSSSAILGTVLNARTFAAPPQTDAPWVRWPLAATVEDAELEAELEQMHAAGIAGAELGQGTFPPISQVGVILRKANQLGLKISLSHGPVSNPDGFTLDDDNARKVVAYGAAEVAGGSSFSGTIPAVTPATTSRTTLIAVVAYKIVGTWSTTTTTTLDFSSAVDLTSNVTGRNTAGVGGGTTTGSLAWQAPSGANWALIALYGVGTIAQPDLLTDAGRLVLTDNMDVQFAPIKDLLRTNGGDLFYDSHTGDRGSPNDTWSNTMAADFKAANGYSVIPYLPLLVSVPTSGFGAAKPAYSFDAVTDAKFNNDFAQTRTDLWINTQIVPLQKWAKKYNQNVRLQPYGQNGYAVDSIQAAAYLDKVETETLWFGDEVDNYLPEASAVHMLGKNWYSIEGSAVLNQAYAMTWQDQVIHMNKAFAGGVTKLVNHIYPYAESSTSVWPGYSLFPDSFANTWGPRSPIWKDAPDYNAYLGRCQQVLAQGSAARDVAVYMQNYTWQQPYSYGNLQYWSDATLERQGYTRDYLNPTLLALPNAKVSNGRLAENGPGYKALILDGQQLPTVAASRSTMPVDTAKRVLGFAKAGLPIIIVGSAPSSSPGINAAADAQVTQLMKQLVALPNVHTVASEAAVPALLANLGILPDAQPDTAGPVLSVHRKDDTTDFYWFYNQGSVISPSAPANTYGTLSGSDVSVTYTLAGQGQPYSLDAWTGAVTPIEQYTTGKGTVTVTVALAKEDTAIVALTTDPSRFGDKKQPVHVVSTTADSVTTTSTGDIVIVAAKAGDYSTTLSNGRVVRSHIDQLPDAVDITANTWQLAAQDWQPAYPYGTTGANATATNKIPVNVTLTGLAPWTSISALTNASGIGVYTTSFTLEKAWTGGICALLNLGSVTDSFTVRINGEDVAFIDQLSATAEVGQYLKAGTNTIEVTVSTTLINRLRTLDKTQSTWPAEPNGLVGPVTLTPRGTAVVG